jgi:hypothetical protein
MNEAREVNPPWSTRLTWGDLLASTYRVYRQRFWKFFRIGLPIALLTYVFTIVQRTLTHQLPHSIARQSFTMIERHGAGWYSSMFWQMLPGLGIGFVTGMVYWWLSVLFFAGVAANVTGNLDEEPGMPSDAYSGVRKRLLPLLIIAILTWTAFFVGREILMLSTAVVVKRFASHPGNLAFASILSLVNLIFTLAVLMVCGLLSRAGLAVPALIDHTATSAVGAIRWSVRKSEGWEFFFILFIAKSALAGYAVYWLAQRGFEQLWHRISMSPTVYSWITWAVYICLFAVLESPLFIAFSILYNEKSSAETTAMVAPAIG